MVKSHSIGQTSCFLLSLYFQLAFFSPCNNLKVYKVPKMVTPSAFYVYKNILAGTLGKLSGAEARTWFIRFRGYLSSINNKPTGN